MRESVLFFVFFLVMKFFEIPFLTCLWEKIFVIVFVFPTFCIFATAKQKQSFIGLWCNGNTTDSGPVIPGSSPGSPTTKNILPLSWQDVLFYFYSWSRTHIAEITGHDNRFIFILKSASRQLAVCMTVAPVSALRMAGVYNLLLYICAIVFWYRFCSCKRFILLW